MVRDVALSGLEKSQYRYNGKKKQPDPLGIGIGLRTPEKGVEFNIIISKFLYQKQM